MVERRIGYAPQVTLIDGSPRVLLVTDRRLILVRDRASGDSFKEFLSTMFSDDVTSLTGPATDYETVDIDELARTRGSISISLVSITNVEFSRTMGGYQVSIDIRTDEGKKGGEFLNLRPPDALVKANKAVGTSVKETQRRYALKCQELFRRVLPQMVMSQSRWQE